MGRCRHSHTQSTSIDVAGEGCAPQTTRMAGRRHKTPEEKREVTLAWAPEKLRRQCMADCGRRTRHHAKMEWLMLLYHPVKSLENVYSTEEQ